MRSVPRVNAPSDRELAEWPTRAAAAILDALFSAGIALVLAGVVFVIAVLAGDSAHAAGDAVRSNAIFIGLPVGLLYAPLLLARPGRRNGQTLGKQLVGIRVVRERTAPMDWPIGLLREAVGKQALSAITFGLYSVVDYLWPLGDAQRQAVHDKIAQTWVVRAEVPAPTAPAPEPAHLLAERGALPPRDRRPPAPRPAPVPEPPKAPAPVPDAPLPGGWLPPVPPGDS